MTVFSLQDICEEHSSINSNRFVEFQARSINVTPPPNSQKRPLCIADCSKFLIRQVSMNVSGICRIFAQRASSSDKERDFSENDLENKQEESAGEL